MNLARLLCLSVLVLATGSLQLATSHAEGGTLSISGTIWQDTNADGIQQPEEYGLSNLTLELGTTYNGQYFYTNAAGQPLYLDSQGHLFRTDANGAYKIEGLNPGPYSVRLMGGLGSNTFFQTYPTRRGSGEYSTAVTLDSQPVTGINFGLAFPKDVTSYRGLAWVDAAPAPAPRVRAMIDGVDCTAPGGLLPTDQASNSFIVGVAPASLIPGCGETGKTISFMLNGRLANNIELWQPATSALPTPIQPPDSPIYRRFSMALTVGAPFAYINAYGIEGNADPNDFQAFVGNVECGHAFGQVWASVVLVVDSDAITPGCGHDGVEVVVTYQGQPAVTYNWRIGPLSTNSLAVQGTPFATEFSNGG